MTLLHGIRNGYLPERKVPTNGVNRCNFVFAEDFNSARRVQHETNIFTDILQVYGHTFSVSETKTHQELYDEIQNLYPIDMIKKM